MEYSSGIILYKKDENTVKFFVCTPDGPFWKNKELWNFPKGHIEDGETPFETAIREFREETSVELTTDVNQYKYLGLIRQNSSKKVHVYVKQYNNENLDNCYSNECETIIKGVKFIHHEIKDYKWMTYEELLKKGIKCYNNIFKEINTW